MKPLDSVETAFTADVRTASKTLICRGLPNGEVVRRLFIKGTFTSLARGEGGAGLAKLKEALDCGVGQISIHHGKISINTTGRKLGLLAAYRYAKPTAPNLDIGAATTSYVHFWEIPLSPPHALEKGFRPRCESIEGMPITFDATLSPMAVTDLITGNAKYELFAQTEIAPVDYRPEPGGIFIETQSNFDGDRLNTKSSMPYILFCKDRLNSFTKYNVEVGQKTLLSNMDEFDGDMLHWEHLPEVRLDGDKPVAGETPGHPFLAEYPGLTGLGVAETQTYHVPFDRRNHKDITEKISVFFTGRSSTYPIQFTEIGWNY